MAECKTIESKDCGDTLLYLAFTTRLMAGSCAAVANRCTIDLQLILEEEEEEEEEFQIVHTVIIRSDTYGRKKRQPLVSVIRLYFEKETLLHQSDIIHLHTIPTHSLFNKNPTALPSESRDFWSSC